MCPGVILMICFKLAPGASDATWLIVEQFTTRYLSTAGSAGRSHGLDPSTTTYLSLICGRGLFDTLMSKPRKRVSTPSNTIPDFALTEITMPAYEIASLLLLIENFATVLRVINGPSNHLELPKVVSVPCSFHRVRPRAHHLRMGVAFLGLLRFLV